MDAISLEPRVSTSRSQESITIDRDILGLARKGKKSDAEP